MLAELGELELPDDDDDDDNEYLVKESALALPVWQGREELLVVAREAGIRIIPPSPVPPASTPTASSDSELCSLVAVWDWDDGVAPPGASTAWEWNADDFPKSTPTTRKPASPRPVEAPVPTTAASPAAAQTQGPQDEAYFPALERYMQNPTGPRPVARCPICLDELDVPPALPPLERPEHPEALCILPCNHIVGLRCLQKYLEGTPRGVSCRCPQCRQNINLGRPAEDWEYEFE